MARGTTDAELSGFIAKSLCKSLLFRWILKAGVKCTHEPGRTSTVQAERHTMLDNVIHTKYKLYKRKHYIGIGIVFLVLVFAALNRCRVSVLVRAAPMLAAMAARAVDAQLHDKGRRRDDDGGSRATASRHEGRRSGGATEAGRTARAGGGEGAAGSVRRRREATGRWH